MWLTQTFFRKIIRGYINADLPFFFLEEEVSCILTVAKLNTQNCYKNEKMLADDWNWRRWQKHMRISFLKVCTRYYTMISQMPFWFIWSVLLLWDHTHMLKRGNWNNLLTKRISLLVSRALPFFVHLRASNQTIFMRIRLLPSVRQLVSRLVTNKKVLTHPLFGLWSL